MDHCVEQPHCKDEGRGPERTNRLPQVTQLERGGMEPGLESRAFGGVGAKTESLRNWRFAWEYSGKASLNKEYFIGVYRISNRGVILPLKRCGMFSDVWSCEIGLVYWYYLSLSSLSLIPPKKQYVFRILLEILSRHHYSSLLHH